MFVGLVSQGREADNSSAVKNEEICRRRPRPLFEALSPQSTDPRRSGVRANCGRGPRGFSASSRELQDPMPEATQLPLSRYSARQPQTVVSLMDKQNIQDDFSTHSLRSTGKLWRGRYHSGGTKWETSCPLTNGSLS